MKIRATALSAFIMFILSLAMVAHVLFTAQARASSPQVRCKVELDRGVLKADETQTAIVKVGLIAAERPECAERPPVNLAIVLDRSSSMTGEKIRKAREAAIEAVRRLQSKDMISLVAYSHKVETIIPARHARDTEALERRIRSIHAHGNTALFGGVSQGASEIRKNLTDKYVHRIILLSDGLANVGPSSPEELARLGAALLKENISVTTVGVGLDYNEDLMTKLARKSDGNTYFVQSTSDLPRIFAAELGDVLSVVAKEVEIRIELPEGIEPLGLIGRDGRIEGRTIKLSMNQLYGGQKKFALVKVRVKGRPAGEEAEIAQARVKFVNALSNQSESSDDRVAVRFSDDSSVVEKSVNVAVQRDFELNRNALAQQEAVRLADEGNIQESVRVLKDSALRLRKIGRKYHDPRLQNEADEVEEQAQTIDRSGLTNVTRKHIQTHSNQTQMQQAPKSLPLPDARSRTVPEAQSRLPYRQR